MTVSDWSFPAQTQQKKHQIKARNTSKVIKKDISQGCFSGALIPNPNSTTCHNVPTINPKPINARWASRQDISSSLALIEKKLI